MVLTVMEEGTATSIVSDSPMDSIVVPSGGSGTSFVPNGFAAPRVAAVWTGGRSTCPTSTSTMRQWCFSMRRDSRRIP